MAAQRRLAPDLRVGFGALVGRVLAVATKLSLAFVVLVVASAVVFL
jgi:hypothetical protein